MCRLSLAWVTSENSTMLLESDILRLFFTGPYLVSSPLCSVSGVDCPSILPRQLLFCCLPLCSPATNSFCSCPTTNCLSWSPATNCLCSCPTTNCLLSCPVSTAFCCLPLCSVSGVDCPSVLPRQLLLFASLPSSRNSSLGSNYQLLFLVSCHQLSLLGSSHQLSFSGPTTNCPFSSPATNCLSWSPATNSQLPLSWVASSTLIRLPVPLPGTARFHVQESFVWFRAKTDSSALAAYPHSATSIHTKPFTRPKESATIFIEQDAHATFLLIWFRFFRGPCCSF